VVSSPSAAFFDTVPLTIFHLCARTGLFALTALDWGVHPTGIFKNSGLNNARALAHQDVQMAVGSPKIP
jgi:hypothetical protein